MKRKIARSVNVRVNVGNFQHIELTNYCEEEIDYSSQQDLLEKENALFNDLIDSVVRDMNSIPDRLGKKDVPIAQLNESITKAIPEWLEKDPIANLAKKKNIQDEAKIESEISKQKKEIISDKAEFEGIYEQISENDSTVAKNKAKVSKETSSDDDFDVFASDEDLFE